jgi:hypothetical protein
MLQPPAQGCATIAQVARLLPPAQVPPKPPIPTGWWAAAGCAGCMGGVAPVDRATLGAAIDCTCGGSCLSLAPGAPAVAAAALDGGGGGGGSSADGGGGGGCSSSPGCCCCCDCAEQRRWGRWWRLAPASWVSGAAWQRRQWPQRGGGAVVAPEFGGAVGAGGVLPARRRPQQSQSQPHGSWRGASGAASAHLRLRGGGRRGTVAVRPQTKRAALADARGARGLRRRPPPGRSTLTWLRRSRLAGGAIIVSSVAAATCNAHARYIRYAARRWIRCVRCRAPSHARVRSSCCMHAYPAVWRARPIYTAAAACCMISIADRCVY